MSVKFMIDSASDISAKEAERMGVSLMSIIISFENESYYDGVDLLPKDFYEKLIESDVLPKTSQITQYRYEEELSKLTANGDEVVIIALSSKLSATYESAVRASKEFGEKVFVVDSLSAAIGERMLLEYGMRLRDKGLSAKEIYLELENVKSKLNVMAVIDTLEYLKKGGRISSAIAFAGELISLKPVVALVDGEVKLIGKAIGSKRGNNHLNRLVQEKGGVNFDMPYGTLYSGLDKNVLEKYIKDSSSIWKDHTDDIPSYILGATIGTHVGPGAVGVAFFSF